MQVMTRLGSLGLPRPAASLRKLPSHRIKGAPHLWVRAWSIVQKGKTQNFLRGSIHKARQPHYTVEHSRFRTHARFVLGHTVFERTIKSRNGKRKNKLGKVRKVGSSGFQYGVNLNRTHGVVTG